MLGKKRVLGIDHSTKTLAFSLCSDGKIEYWEEIALNGDSVYERLGDLYLKLENRFENENIDVLVIEKTARVNSNDAVIKLGFIAGAIISYFAAKGTKIFETPALSWQSATAKPTLNKQDKLALRTKNPGRLRSWYKNEERKIRKQRIIDWVSQELGIVAPSDAADSICISYFGDKVLT